MHWQERATSEGDINALAKTILVSILVALVTSCLWAATVNEISVIRLTAHIPENTTFTRYNDGFIMRSNSNNFSYSMQQVARTQMVFVMAL